MSGSQHPMSFWQPMHSRRSQRSELFSGLSRGMSAEDKTGFLDRSSPYITVFFESESKARQG